MQLPRGTVLMLRPNAFVIVIALSAYVLPCCAQVVRPEKKPKQEAKYTVKMPGVGRGNIPASHASFQPRAKKEQNENLEPEPQYGVLPSSINQVSCPTMSSFLLQDPALWIALQAMDGSGEVLA